MALPDTQASSANGSANGSRSGAGRAFDAAAATRSFQENGYAVLPGLISKTTLADVTSRLFEEFERWKNSNAKFDGGGLLAGHLNCYPGEVARGVMNELTSAGVFELTQRLLPTDPRAVRLGCNFNLPGSVEQHYHVDSAFLEAFMIVNIAVVDTTIENGAIDVIPHTHKRFYKYWEFAAGRVYKGTQRICMSQGDVLLRPSTLWHRGMPNFSDKARPMLAVTLGEKNQRTDNPFAYADGKVEFQTNWFKTDLLGRMRERVTIAAPITYSAYRFVRSLVGNKGYASY